MYVSHTQIKGLSEWLPERGELGREPSERELGKGVKAPEGTGALTVTD